MSVSNGIITAPVSIDDVNNVLGHGSTDLGTLCTSSKINKWALKKPVRHTSLNLNLTDSYWYRGESGTCGFDIPWCKSDNLASYLEDIDREYGIGNIVEWGYLKPNGTPYPYRLLDFEGYNHGAVRPFIDWDSEHKYIIGVGRGTFHVTMKSASLAGDNFSPDKAVLNGASLGDYYLGFLIVDERMGVCYIGTSSVTLSEESGYIGYPVFPMYKYTEGTYYKYSILCSVSTIKYVIQGDKIPSCNIVFLGDKPEAVNLLNRGSAYIYFQVTVELTDDGKHKITENLVGVNLTGEGISIDNLTYKLQYPDERDESGWLTLQTLDISGLGIGAGWTTPTDLRYGGSCVFEDRFSISPNIQDFRIYLETTQTNFYAGETSFRLEAGFYE